MSYIEPSDFTVDASILRVVAHVYQKHMGNIQKKYVHCAHDLEIRYSIRIDPKKIKSKIKDIETALADEDTELDYDSDAMRQEITARYPIRTGSSSSSSSSLPISSSSATKRPLTTSIPTFTPASSYSSGATTPTEFTRMKQSVDRISASMTSCVSNLTQMSFDLTRIANAIAGDGRKGIVESIKKLNQGINLEDEDEDEFVLSGDEEPERKKQRGNAGKKLGGKSKHKLASCSSSSSIFSAVADDESSLETEIVNTANEAKQKATAKAKAKATKQDKQEE